MNIAVPPKATAPTVTTKHLAYALAEQHQLSKKQSLEMMEELVSMITKHLKKGERRRDEKALDEALKNTFPASDPVSVEQPVST